MRPHPVVLITGCSEGGIGFALCEAFASRRCQVYATARNLSSLSALSPSINRLELEVTSASSCAAAVAHVIETEGRIDILVNNAGRGGTGALLDFTIDEAQKTMDVNLFAPMRLCQLLIPHMVKEKESLIINIGSLVGNIPTPWAGVYATSKAALHAYTETLRMEVEGFGINVMLVAPGGITSNFGQKQVDSINMPSGSLYTNVADRIRARAMMSQTPGSSMPASILAKGIVDRSLRTKPAVYYSAGGRSWLFWIFERLPRWIVWAVLKRSLGVNEVRLRRT